jgi:hypothetical protein
MDQRGGLGWATGRLAVWLARAAEVTRFSFGRLCRTLRHALDRSFGPPPERRGKEGGWLGDVSRAVGDLEEVNRSTEAGFLAVGEKLSGFLRTARQVSASATATAERLSGEQAQRDAGVLKRVLEETARMQRSAESATGLARVLDSAKGLRQVFSGFDNTVISFHVLAVLARIETARLGQSGAGLVHLVEEMRGCGDDIASRTGRILATAASLGRRVEAEINRISDLDARELRALPPLMEAVALDFRTLRCRKEQGEAAAGRLGSQFAEVSEAIGGVVQSIQFHDITRQQIEHVIQALQQVHDSAARASRGAPTGGEAAILALQVAQLDNARRTFLDSIDRIDGELESIAKRVSEMASESERLAGQSEGQSETFFAGMAGRFADILKAARECESCDSGARTALDDLRQALAALDAALADIQAIEVHLKRVALNAAIQAVHLGGAGEPFNAVALAMHGLQSDCESRSAQSHAELHSIGAAIRGAAEGGMRPEAAEGSGMANAVTDLRERMQEMYAANTRGIASFQEIGSLVSRLLSDIQAARRDLSESRARAEVIEESCARLRTWAGDGSAAEGHLDDWAQNYTIRTEHAVHRELTGAGPPPNEPAAASPASGELELF